MHANATSPTPNELMDTSAAGVHSTDADRLGTWNPTGITTSEGSEEWEHLAVRMIFEPPDFSPDHQILGENQKRVLARLLRL
jgi:hypothetical protein